VTGVRRISTLLAGAAAGAFAATVLLRRRRPSVTPERLDPRAQELREKLAEARSARADENDFAAAGMAAETAVEEPAAPPPAPPRPPAETAVEKPVASPPAPPRAPAETAVEKPAAPPPAPPRPPAETADPERPKPGGPADEFEAMRRRVHEEGRAAAEEMRRDPEDGAD
jgi:hypothetical protein